MQTSNSGITEQTRCERWVMVASITASAMAFIDGTALNVAMPAIQSDLQAGGSEILWFVNAYLLMLAALILPGGAVGDILGRRRVFSVGITLFVVASLFCGFAPTTSLLIAGRAVQGIGGAIMIPGSLAMIAAVFPSRTRGRAIGTWSGVAALVTMIGPLLGGYLADLGQWRLIFFLNIPMGALALFALQTRVTERQDYPRDRRVDWVGAALAVIGLGGITYGFIDMPARGFTHPLVIGTMFAGALALILFVVWQAKARRPMMPLHLFRVRTFSGANLLTLMLYGAISVATFFMSLNFVQAQGYSQTQAGLAFFPFAIAIVVLSRWAGSLADKLGPRLLLVTGPLLVAVGMYLTSRVGLTDGFADYWVNFFPGLGFMGLGMGLTVAPLTTAAMGSVAESSAGTASGINNAVSRAAAVLAMAIVGAAAILQFGAHLEEQFEATSFPASHRAAMLDAAAQMGDARVPAGIPVDQQAAAAHMLRSGFAEVCADVMLWSAVLAVVAALLAAWTIDKRELQDSALNP